MSQPDFKITPSIISSTTVLSLAGHLNALTAPKLEQAVAETLASRIPRLVLDCSALTYSSSAGLRVFLTTAKRMKASGGTCAFAALTPQLREVFEMSGFLDVMEVHPTLEAATA